MSEIKLVLVTGGACRIGRSIALAVARAGADVVVHYQQSKAEAESLRAEINALGRKAILLQADLAQPTQVSGMIPRILEHGTLNGLVNNAAIFEKLNWESTRLEDWNRHLMINGIFRQISQRIALAATTRPNELLRNPIHSIMLLV
jgi:NAD(P)-dependent dehydrogenase (short-subunit alcohol dehydrogenase family)